MPFWISHRFILPVRRLVDNSVLWYNDPYRCNAPECACRYGCR